MDTHGTSTKTVVSVAVLLLLGAAIAMTQPFQGSATRANVCVKRNGQLRMPASGEIGCAPSERLVQWVVDGEVTDVSVGPGLVATRQGGLVKLAVDPSFLNVGNATAHGVRRLQRWPGADPPGMVPVVGALQADGGR
jgi:hypothetical protein